MLTQKLAEGCSLALRSIMHATFFNLHVFYRRAWITPVQNCRSVYLGPRTLTYLIKTTANAFIAHRF